MLDGDQRDGGVECSELEHLLPPVCIHLGLTPYIRGVTVGFSSLGFGGIVTICSAGIKWPSERVRSKFTRISPRR